VQAILIGVALWIAGTVCIGLVGRLPLYVSLAVPATLVLTPAAMFALTKLHLRGVPQALRPAVGLRFGVIVTAAQFPLDALGLFWVFNYGILGLSAPAQHSTVIALEVAYFWMLLTPWWAGSRMGV
jgi:hypothetical protein